MASIKIFDLHSNLRTSVDSKEFMGAIESAIARALDARQLQNIRGGLQPSITQVTPPIFVGIILSQNEPR